MSTAQPGAIQRVMHEIKRRRLHVLRVTDLTPRMRRITLGGPALAGFLSLGADDHIKLFFAQNPQEQAWLDAVAAGQPAADGIKPAMRDYTPRRYDAQRGELDVDFVLHGDGPASTWAAQASVGQHLDIAGPRGSMVVPDVFDSYLLIGDETALPAIARRLEELPAGRQVQVLVEIASATEQQPLSSQADVQVQWIERQPGRLLAAVEALTPGPGELFVFAATEKALSRQLKQVLLQKPGVREEAMKVAGYWRLDENDDE